MGFRQKCCLKFVQVVVPESRVHVVQTSSRKATKGLPVVEVQVWLKCLQREAPVYGSSKTGFIHVDRIFFRTYHLRYPPNYCGADFVTHISMGNSCNRPARQKGCMHKWKLNNEQEDNSCASTTSNLYTRLRQEKMATPHDFILRLILTLALMEVLKKYSFWGKIYESKSCSPSNFLSERVNLKFSWERGSTF